MSGQTATRTRFSIRRGDQRILRELAKQVAELSAHPIEQEKCERWYRHNALEPARPLVFYDPENGWNERNDPHRVVRWVQIAKAEAESA
ncbi:MAG: hypothetical protein C4335_03345 [Armatimonadota bacterium]